MAAASLDADEFDTGGWIPQEPSRPYGNEGIEALLGTKPSAASTATARFSAGMNQKGSAPGGETSKLAVNNVGAIVLAKANVEIPPASEAPPPSDNTATASKDVVMTQAPVLPVSTEAPPYPDEYDKKPHEKVRTVTGFINLSHGPTPSTSTGTTTVGSGYVPSGQSGAQGNAPGSRRDTQAIQQDLPKPPPAANPQLTVAMEAVAVEHAKEIAEKAKSEKKEKHSSKRKKSDPPKPEARDPEKLPEAAQVATAPSASDAPQKKHKHHKKDKSKEKHEKKDKKEKKEKKHKKDKKSHGSHHHKDKKKRKHKEASEGEESDGSLDSEERRAERHGRDLDSEDDSRKGTDNEYEEDSFVENDSSSGGSGDEIHGRNEYIEGAAKPVSNYELKKQKEFEKFIKKEKRAKKEAKKEKKRLKRESKKKKNAEKSALEKVAQVKKGLEAINGDKLALPLLPCNSKGSPLDERTISAELDQALVAVSGYLAEYHHKTLERTHEHGILYSDADALIKASLSGLCEPELWSQATVARRYLFGAGASLDTSGRTEDMPIGVLAKRILENLSKGGILDGELVEKIVASKDFLTVVKRSGEELAELEIRRRDSVLGTVICPEAIKDILEKALFWLRPIDSVDTLVCDFAFKRKGCNFDKMSFFEPGFAKEPSQVSQVIPTEFVPWASEGLARIKRELLCAHAQAVQILSIVDGSSLV